MPRMDHRAIVPERLTPQEDRLLRLLLGELNLLREQVGLEPRTVQDVQQRLREMTRPPPPEGSR